MVSRQLVISSDSKLDLPLRPAISAAAISNASSALVLDHTGDAVKVDVQLEVAPLQAIAAELLGGEENEHNNFVSPSTPATLSFVGLAPAVYWRSDEVDIASTPISEWNPSDSLIAALQARSVIAKLWIDESGVARKVEVDGDLPDHARIELSNMLMASEYVAAQKNNKAAASVKQIEFKSSKAFPFE